MNYKLGIKLLGYRTVGLPYSKFSDLCVQVLVTFVDFFIIIILIKKRHAVCTDNKGNVLFITTYKPLYVYLMVTEK